MHHHEQISRNYHRLTATIRGGLLTGLIGPDGAGKTTLLRIMSALMIPSEGTLKIKGLDVANRASEVHAITGYMPQRFGLYEDPAVIENLNLYADLQGLLGKERKSIFDGIRRSRGENGVWSECRDTKRYRSTSPGTPMSPE